MEKFFKPRKRKSNIDLSGEGEPKEPKEKKKKKSTDDSIKELLELDSIPKLFQIK